MVTVAEAVKAAIDKPLAVHGVNQHTLVDAIAEAKSNPLASHGGHGTAKSSGTTVDYTLRRLARDNPAMLDAIKDGTLSVNAAAIKAGIRKKPTKDAQCVAAFAKAENRLDTLKAIGRILNKHEVAWAIEAFSSMLQNGSGAADE